MKTQFRKVELLAPAGSREALIGALNAGADAVYLGGERFGARAYADNFSDEELVRAIKEAHIFGKKVYLTANILTREKELPDLASFVKKMYAAGLDGVIVQDLGVLQALREACPGLPLHASTQMSVTSSEAVRYLRRLGVCRVVPARELSLDEIRMLREEDAADLDRIFLKKESGREVHVHSDPNHSPDPVKAEPIEIEAFIHGAMCYSYSGRCLMSSFLGGRSGNRGRCAGTCRLPYRILDDKGRPAGPDARRKETYPLSMKDMCVLSILPELIDAGITSFKIEGRMKKPVYAAGVTAIYRKYIDRCYAWMEAGRPQAWKVDEDDLEKLRSLYIRTDLGTGYYHSRNGRDLVTIGKPGYAGTDPSLEEMIRRKYLGGLPRLEISGRAVFRTGEPAVLSVQTVPSGKEDMSSGRDRIVSALSCGALVQPASGKPMSVSDLDARLRKTGDSLFVFSALDIEADESIFLPVSAVNALRRDALSKLKSALSGPDRPLPAGTDSDQAVAGQTSGDQAAAGQTSGDRAPDEGTIFARTGKKRQKGSEKGSVLKKELWAMVSTYAQLAAAVKGGCGCVVIDFECGPLADTLLKDCLIPDRPSRGDGNAFFKEAVKEALKEAVKKSVMEADEKEADEIEADQKEADQQEAVKEADPDPGRGTAGGWPGKTGEEALSEAFPDPFSGRKKRKKRTHFGNNCTVESGKTRLVLALPPVFRVSEREKIREMIISAREKGFSGILVRTLEELETARQLSYDGEIIADASLYTWNSASMQLITGDCSRIVCSLEMNQAWIREAVQVCEERTADKLILPVYGRVPMMETAGCVRKTENKCSHKDGFWFLEDRTGRRLPVRCRCGSCSNTIYNAVPLSLHQFAGRGLMAEVPAFLCMFTTESGQDTARILEFFGNLKSGTAGPGKKAVPASLPFSEFTNGHYKNGAL